MTTDRSTRKLAVILHADVMGSTTLVQRDETLSHERIRAYGGTPREVRGDALLATFARASDVVSALMVPGQVELIAPRREGYATHRS